MSATGRTGGEPAGAQRDGEPAGRTTPIGIALKLYASLADHLPPEARRTNRLELRLPPGTTVAAVIEARALPPKSCHLVLVNGVYVPPAERADRALRDGDELAIWPPIAGG